MFGPRPCNPIFLSLDGNLRQRVETSWLPRQHLSFVASRGMDMNRNPGVALVKQSPQKCSSFGC